MKPTDDDLPDWERAYHEWKAGKRRIAPTKVRATKPALPLSPVCTIAVPVFCRCGAVIPVDTTAVTLDGLIYCVPCAFEKVKELW